MIYLDCASTTMVKEEVLNSMLPYLKEDFFNPSNSSSKSSMIKVKINKVREKIAKIINAEIDEIYFTSSGTEANNMAIRGLLTKDKNHIITTKIEHKSIINTCKYLESLGVDITYLDIKNGKIDIQDLKENITDKTALVSLFYVNNEVGIISNIDEVGEFLNKENIPFHTDAVQAFLHQKIDVKKQNISLLSASGHKIGAPKGIGFIYIKKGINITPLIFGGEQENGKRAGTENVSHIIGLGKACELLEDIYLENTEYIYNLKKYLIDKLYALNLGIEINGNIYKTGILNIYIPNIKNDYLMTMLELNNIFVSTGSACMAGVNSISHVLKALKFSDDRIKSSIRISFNENIKNDDIDKFIVILEKIINNKNNSFI